MALSARMPLNAVMGSLLDRSLFQLLDCRMALGARTTLSAKMVGMFRAGCVSSRRAFKYNVSYNTQRSSGQQPLAGRGRIQWLQKKNAAAERLHLHESFFSRLG